MTRRARNVARRRCAVEGCTRSVRAGKLVCVDHARSARGKEAQRAVHRLTDDLMAAAGAEGTGKDAVVHGTFRQRVARGDYGALLDKPLQEVLWQAGAVRSFQEEIGALRLAAKRLLLEEEDPGKMALGISRATSTLVRLLERKEEVERVWRGEARDEQRQAEWEARQAQARADEDAAKEQAAPQAEKEKRYTIADAVKEWRARQGEAGGESADAALEGAAAATTGERKKVRPEIDYSVPWDGNPEGIIDSFAERLPGGWLYEQVQEEERAERGARTS